MTYLSVRSPNSKQNFPATRNRPLTARDVVKYCRTSGGRLVKSLASKGHVIFLLEPAEVRIDETQAVQAIFSGQLVGESDGLFGNSQTWVAKP